MRKIVVFTNLTLDGVMQAPGRPDEDMRGGFKYGGWAAPYGAMSEGDGMGDVGALLMGRRTYEDFYAFWPKQTDGNPFTGMLNNMQKYVASRTLKEPLAWENSTLLKGDVVDAVAQLKGEEGKDILVMGSGDLIQSLMRGNLVDDYVLMIHPLVLGTGRKLFADGGPDVTLNLDRSKATSKGVVIATYHPTETTASGGGSSSFG
jgi:dihydrofolate reductase